MRLIENPDGVLMPDKNLNWNDYAVPFGMYKGKMYVGPDATTHGQIRIGSGFANRDILKYSGRLWYKDKVITFWEFPPKNKMKSVISQIEKAAKEQKMSLKIWNNGYKIEVVDKGGEIYDPHSKRWGYEDMSTSMRQEYPELPPGAYITFIPLEDFEGSKKQIGKGKSHVVSPMIKTTKQVPKGMGSRKKVKGAKKGEIPVAAKFRTRKGMGDGIIKLGDLITENPDAVAANDIYLGYNESQAYPFGFYKGKAYVGDPGRTHFQIKKDLLDRGELSNRDYDDFPYTRREFKHTGRLWADDKVISFWEFPTQNQIKSMISKIEKAIGKKIWNNGWKIEVVDKGGKIYRPKRKGSDIDPGWSDYDFEGHVKLIPLEDYQGSQKQIGKELSHQKSPVLKKKKEVPMGLGSRKKVKGARKGETPAAARHRLRKGLGDDVNKSGDVIKESSYNDNSKRLGRPKGKAPYMETDGVSDLPKSWEAKIKYWQEMILKMTGYEVVEEYKEKK